MSDTSPGKPAKRLFLIVANSEAKASDESIISQDNGPDDVAYLIEPRGLGKSRWTMKNPPNYVARAHVLLGRTIDTGRVWDVIATARYLRQTYAGNTPIIVAGSEGAAVLAAYAALLEGDLSGIVVHHPATSHMQTSAPVLLNVLRVGDVPDILGMLAPRPLTISSADSQAVRKVVEIYSAAGAADRIKE